MEKNTEEEYEPPRRTKEEKESESAIPFVRFVVILSFSSVVSYQYF
jgi:hypothetical protein